MRGPEPLKPKLPRGIEKQAFNQINFFLVADGKGEDSKL